jgi:hypothetical protein
MVNNENSNLKQVRAPVYIPFKTFLTAIETLEPGIPPILDRSVFPTFSGGLQSQVLGAFKFLGLIKDDGSVEPLLQKLVNAKGDERKLVLRDIIRTKYAKAVELAEANASYGQLEDYFRNYNITGGTLYRVVRFFIEACTYAGEKCSTHWAKAKKSPKRAIKKEVPNEESSEHGTPQNKVDNSGIASGFLETVTLPEIGTVTLSTSINPLKLKGTSREWFYQLVDKLGEYPKE